MRLDRDGFTGSKPIRFTPSLDRISFEIENRSHDRHETTLTLLKLPPGIYHVLSGKTALKDITSNGNSEMRITVPMNADETSVTITGHQAGDSPNI